MTIPVTDLSPQATSTLAGRLSDLAADIKIGHTIFALPWAILATFLAARANGQRTPAVGQLALIVACMVLARTAAMAANRLFDAKLDAANPRTAGRAIPAGRLSNAFYAATLAACAAGFVLAAAGFYLFFGNGWPVTLALPVLTFLCLYPFTKRFTALCHFYLGIALGLAPVCAWVAIRGPLAAEPLLIGVAVFLWTAGFDIIYACQDYAHDVAAGIFSVPARVGIGNALWISRTCHAASISLLVTLVFVSPMLSTFFAIGVTIAAALLIVEQSLVSPRDLSKVNLAFFTINGVVAVVVAGLGLVDVVRNF